MELNPRDLRSRIVANPDDLGLRQVYADLLIERGDPRGLFIAAQCLGLESVATDLQRQYRKNLFGSLPHSATVNFKNGFIESWSTTNAEFRRTAEQLLRTSPLRKLQVSGLDENGLEYLLRSRGLSNLEELELSGVRACPWVRLGKCEGLPRLRSLKVSGVMSQAGLSTFCWSPLALQLERLVINDRRIEGLNDWVLTSTAKKVSARGSDTILCAMAAWLGCMALLRTCNL